ncbi:GRP family sugar transporter [Hymenobacter baengnokdamensis]|uniref:GRP family sugar transporter n=1 Tax=Hymenobacter baengnokdamensis TaxID=2615203 RepID=UPI001243B9DE|nr:GRP family sugar transporter [Hymenobacter baengnokdamensis]
MFLIQQTGVAIGVCLLAMLCWGSWSNGQKLVADAKVPITLFYRDYVLGILLLTAVLVSTLGSFGSQGRPFVADVRQAAGSGLGLVLAAGLVFNLGNQLLVAAIQAAGLAIAMPVGSGIALALGLVVNYVAEPQGNVWLLAAGGALVLVSIACSAVAYAKKAGDKDQGGKSGNSQQGLLIAGAAGVANGFFFRMVTSPLAKDFAHPKAGALTPYTALALFGLGLALSNPVVEQVLRHFADTPEAAQVRYSEVAARQHGIGIGSGVLWGAGMAALLLASTKAGNAVSFGLSQGATIVAVLWGLFAWHEFKDAPAPAYRWLWAMAIAYVLGVGLIVAARLG